jgi:hypothetical protein
MIALKDFMEAVEFKITEGSDFQWNCYGPYAYRLDSWSGHYDCGYSCSIVFDTKDQTVYEAEVNDYKNARSYRLINPDFNAARIDEAKSRDVDDDIAYDDVKFTILETDEDFLEKVHAIVAGLEYDSRVQVPLDMSRDELFELMSAAHKQDVTLNDYVQRVLKSYIDEQI